MHHHLLPYFRLVEAGSLPSNPSDFSSSFFPNFAHKAYTVLYGVCSFTDQMRSLLFQQLLSQHPAPHTPEGSSVLLLRFFTPSVPLDPFRANLSTLLCEACFAIHFMLRAAVLLSFLRRLHRFTILAQGITTSHPAAMDACYLAA